MSVAQKVSVRRPLYYTPRTAKHFRKLPQISRRAEDVLRRCCSDPEARLIGGSQAGLISQM